MSACLAYDLPLSELNVTACVPCLLRIHFIRFCRTCKNDKYKTRKMIVIRHYQYINDHAWAAMSVTTASSQCERVELSVEV